LLGSRVMTCPTVTKLFGSFVATNLSDLNYEAQATADLPCSTYVLVQKKGGVWSRFTTGEVQPCNASGGDVSIIISGAPNAVSFRLSGIISNDFAHCTRRRQEIIRHLSEIARFDVQHNALDS
jgi:hypothetical protein